MSENKLESNRVIAVVMPKEEHEKLDPRPVILEFQPSDHVIVKEPAVLRQWESELQERLGARGFPICGGGGVCDTITMGRPDACDID